MICRLSLLIPEPAYFILHRHFTQSISCMSNLSLHRFFEDKNWHRWYKKSGSIMGFGGWFTQSPAQGGHLTTNFISSDLGKHHRLGKCCCLYNESYRGTVLIRIAELAEQVVLLLPCRGIMRSWGHVTQLKAKWRTKICADNHLKNILNCYKTISCQQVRQNK